MFLSRSRRRAEHPANARRPLIQVGLVVLLMVGLIVATSGNASAVTNTLTWTGATSGNWSDAANWTPAAVPKAADTLVFPDVASNKAMTYDVTGYPQFGKLKFTGSGYTLVAYEWDRMLYCGGIDNQSTSGTVTLNVEFDLMNIPSFVVSTASGGTTVLNGLLKAYINNTGITFDGAGTTVLPNNPVGDYNLWDTRATSNLTVAAGTLSVQSLDAGNYAGTITVKSGATLDTPLVSGSRPTIGSTVVVEAGGRFSGAPYVIKPVSIAGILAPSDATGLHYAQFCNTLGFEPGGSYEVDVSSAGRNLNDEAMLTFVDSPRYIAIDSSAASPFTIKLMTPDSGPADFNPAQSYTWLVAYSYWGFDGYDAGDIVLDTTGFKGSPNGTFSLNVTTDSIYVKYTPRTPVVWDGGGGDNKWSTAANWVGDVCPADGDDVVFSGSTRTSPVCDASFDGMTLGSVTFASPGFTVTSVGGPVLTLTKGIYNTCDSGDSSWQVWVRIPAGGATIKTANASATTKLENCYVYMPKGATLTADGDGTFTMNTAFIEDTAGTTDFVVKAGTTYWCSGGGYGSTTTVEDGGTLSFPTDGQYAVIGAVDLQAGGHVTGGAATVKGPFSVAGTVTLGTDNNAIWCHDDVTLLPGGCVELACSYYGGEASGFVGVNNLSDWRFVGVTNSLIVKSDSSSPFTIKPTFDSTVRRSSKHDYAAFLASNVSGYDAGDLVVDGSGITDCKGTVDVWADPSGPFFLGFRYTPLPTYTISCTLGTGATISPDISSTSDTVTKGDSPTYTFGMSASYPGKYISGVKIDDVLQDPTPTSYTFNSVSTDHTIQVLTADRTFGITASAGGNGRVSPAGTTNVTYDGSQTYYVYPDFGYQIDDVKVDDVSQGAITSYEFTNVKAAHKISATFKKKTFTITPSAGAGGSISPNTTQIVDFGGSRSFTITPGTGYHVASVMIDGAWDAGAVTSYDFTSVDVNHTIDVTFAKNTYDITVNAGTGGSISPSAASVEYDGSQTFSVAADPGWTISNVTVDNVSQGAITSYTFSHVTATHTISATFTQNSTNIWGGFLTPLALTDSRVFNRGSTIPVKFVLMHPKGKPIVNMSATLTCIGPNRSYGPYRFAYDKKGDLYLYNLKTAGWPSGFYTFTVTLGDGSTHPVRVYLK